MNVICFGQQPNGFFPKRFLVAKINTAKKLRDDIGGRIVFFYHDSDADYRETITIMRDRLTGAEVRLNFLQPNKIQKKFSPLYAKKIAKGWKQETLKQLPRFLPAEARLRRTKEGVDKNLIDVFSSTDENLTAADFCLEMYRKMGLLEGIEVVRSSNRNFRERAAELTEDFFADVEYQGEIVRAQIENVVAPFMGLSDKPDKSGNYKKTDQIGILHEGGGKFIRFDIQQPIEKWQKSPGRDQRFAWMQSVIHCSHYIYGEGEKEYLDKQAYSEVKFMQRQKIEQPDFAFTEILNP